MITSDTSLLQFPEKKEGKRKNQSYIAQTLKPEMLFSLVNWREGQLQAASTSSDVNVY